MYTFNTNSKDSFEIILNFVNNGKLPKIGVVVNPELLGYGDPYTASWCQWTGHHETRTIRT